MNKHNFSIVDVLLFGLTKTKEKYLYILQVMIFVGLALYIARSVAQPVEVLIMLCLGISMTTVFLMISRGQKTVFSDLFKKYKGYEVFVNYILASLVFGVLVSVSMSLLIIALFVLGLLGLLSTLSTFSTGTLGTLLVLIPLMLPGIYVIIRLQFYKFFVIDKDMGPIPALKSSWKITKGHFWKLAQYLLVIAIINIAVGLLVNLGGNYFYALLLVTIPVIAIASAYLYETLSGETEK